jgi:hypothetical protein
LEEAVEFSFRAYLYLHIGGLETAFTWNGIGPTNLQVTGRGLYNYQGKAWNQIIDQ